VSGKIEGKIFQDKV